MNKYDIFLVGIGLAMDAFAVSICKGMSFKKNSHKKSLIIGAYFGFFQALMPIIGYFIISKFSYSIRNIDHWIAFLLLLIIGIKMIKDSILNDDILDDKTGYKTMIPLSFATSIDALAVGITLTFLKANIYLSSLFIGLITFIMCYIGPFLGKKVGDRFGNNSQLLGGFILIVIGIKILFEHLNIL